MRLIVFSTVLLLALACQKTNQREEFPKVENYAELVGNMLVCDANEAEAYVYLFAPHLSAVLHPDQDKQLEYYRSEFIHKNGGVYFRAFMYGTPSLKTDIHNKEMSQSHHMAIHVNKDELKVVLTRGLEAGSRRPIDPQVFDCKVYSPISTIVDRFDQKIIRQRLKGF